MSTPTSAGPVYNPGPRFKAGRWAAVIVLLPLAVIAIMTWVGARAVVDQASADLRRMQQARTELLAAHAAIEFRRILDTLSSAAQHQWTDPTALPGLSQETRLTLHTLSDPPADHVRHQAFRQARGVGTAVVQRKSNGNPTLVFAAANLPGQPERIALAELSPDDLLALLKRAGLEPGAVLLNRTREPICGLGDTTVRWGKDGSSNNGTDDGSWLRTETPLQDFSFSMGMRMPEPDFITLLYTRGKNILYGGLGCAIFTIVLSGLLIVQVRRRLDEADKSRQFALQEIEHVQKLSSIGRLAAGVAHEINNPLAIIAEKSGLMKDLVLAMPDMPRPSVSKP